MTPPINSVADNILDQLNHPLRVEIDYLRTLILSSGSRLSENIKWNGPNYFLGEAADRITMKIHPPKNIQLVFHRGAKKNTPSRERTIEHPSARLQWKDNDRVIMTFRNLQEIKEAEGELREIVEAWVDATR